MLVMGTTDASLLIIIHCSNVFYLFLLLAKLYKVFCLSSIFSTLILFIITNFLAQIF